MNGTKRPLSVTILGCLYIGVGAVGFVYHFPKIQAHGALQYDDILVELVELLALTCGVFILRGHNWARWLALAWIAVHVILSAFHAFSEFAIHCLFCAAITWFLFRPGVTPYFRHERVEPT